jgi:cobalt/nickel transport system permease protein
MSRVEAALARLGSLDELAGRDTPAARVDARAKLVVTIAYVATVASFGRGELARLAPLALFPAVMLALGDVPLRPILVRLALASPFALGVALFEPILDRSAAVVVLGVPVSGGWLSFASILARFALSVGAALLLVATTGFDRVAAALRRLGAPRALVVQLLFTWRYLFVLGGEAARMLRARDLRAPGSRRLPLALGAQLVGVLLLRALERAQRVHAAMICRGFDGTFPPRRVARFGPGDLSFTLGWLVFLAGVRVYDLPRLLGATLAGAAS